MGNLSLKFKIYSMVSIIGVVTALAIVSVLSLMEDAKDDSNIIDILGRQRMLSQSMAKVVLGNAIKSSLVDKIQDNIRILNGFITSMRTVYTDSIIAPILSTDIPISMSPNLRTHTGVPFPATFTRMVNTTFSEASEIAIDILSDTPVNPRQGLKTKMDREAYQQLLQARSRILMMSSHENSGIVLHFYSADLATSQACVDCHTQKEKRPYKLNDILGIRKFTVPLSQNVSMGNEMLDASLQEYETTLKIFEQTLSAFRLGGKYPTDLKLNSFNEVAPIKDAAFQEIAAHTQAALNRFKATAKLILSGLNDPQVRLIAVSNIVNQSNRVRELSDDLVQTYAAIAKHNQTAIRAALLIAGIGIFIVIGVIVAFFAQSIITPLRNITNVMSNIAEENLTVEVPGIDRGDEIGEMAKALEVFKQNVIDKNKREQARIEANMAKEKAEAANIAKSQFLASMSHELRTPLNAILGFAQMLEYDPQTDLTSKQEEHVKSIQKGGEHLLTLVNEILDLAKIEADQLSLSLEEVDAGQIISECISLMNQLGEPHGIRIVNAFNDNLPHILMTDRMRTKQVLLNLLSNAIKYNREGGMVTVKGWQEDDRFLYISVTDTGYGIAVDEHPNVFQMFHRLGIDPTIAKEGTGIGLAVSKLLIERMAGRIGFESEEGRGSTFWLKLPLATNDDVLIWTDSMRIGIDAIDKDHQVLILLLNRLTHSTIEDAELDGIIRELTAYTRYHFQREEAIMEACGYTNLTKHALIHTKLSAQVKELSDKWNATRDPKILNMIRDFLRNWLLHHIINVDTELSQYASGHEHMIRAALEKQQ